jgi:hypothetical protein
MIEVVDTSEILSKTQLNLKKNNDENMNSVKAIHYPAIERAAYIEQEEFIRFSEIAGWTPW